MFHLLSFLASILTGLRAAVAQVAPRGRTRMPSITLPGDQLDHLFACFERLYLDWRNGTLPETRARADLPATPVARPSRPPLPSPTMPTPPTPEPAPSRARSRPASLPGPTAGRPPPQKPAKPSSTPSAKNPPTPPLIYSRPFHYDVLLITYVSQPLDGLKLFASDNARCAPAQAWAARAEGIEARARAMVAWNDTVIPSAGRQTMKPPSQQPTPQIAQGFSGV